MAWTALPTWTVGQVSLASDWNTYVAGNLNFLAQLPTILCAPTAQTVTTSGGALGITISATPIVQQGGFTSASTSAITVTLAGVWLLTWQVTYQSGGGGVGAAGTYQAQVYHNSSAVIYSAVEYASAGQNPSPGNSVPVLCSVNDTFQPVAYQNSGANEGTGYLNNPVAGYNTWIGVTLVSGTTGTG